MEIAGAKDAFGALLLVSEKDGVLTYRVAGPDDMIVLKQAVTVLGKEYPAGHLPVPPGGTLTPQ